jgi:hypothetical protein
LSPGFRGSLAIAFCGAEVSFRKPTFPRADQKGRLSLVGYLCAIALSFVAVWAADLIYVAIALTWLIPDRRIERVVGQAPRSMAD